MLSKAMSGMVGVVGNKETLIKELSAITPKEWYEFTAGERLAKETTAVMLNAFCDGFDILRDFYNRVESHEKKVGYRFTCDRRGEILFGSASEIEEYFGCDIRVVWRKYRNGDIAGSLKRVNELHILDPQGNTLDVKSNKVPIH